MKEKNRIIWFIISIITFLILFIIIGYAYYSKLSLEIKIIIISICSIGIVYDIKDYYSLIKERSKN